MKSKTTSAFRKHYRNLPVSVRRLAVKSYRLFKQNPYYPSLQFKLLQGKENLYSVRIGQKYRAMGNMTAPDEITWFWIGPHEEYDTRLK